MDLQELVALDEAQQNFTHQWSVSEGSEPFGDELAAYIHDGNARKTSANALDNVLQRENAHVLCLAMPAEWFDVSAERICDIMHMKTVYEHRSNKYASGSADMQKTRGEGWPSHALAVQLFFQLVTVLWRWKDSNDRLLWDEGGLVPSDPEDDEDDDDAARKKKKKKKRKKQRPVLAGAVRRECAMAVDWRWRPLCKKCATARAAKSWTVVFCDHVDNPADVCPVLDYTFWFIVRGWPRDVWRRRVGYAMIAVLQRMHLRTDGTPEKICQGSGKYAGDDDEDEDPRAAQREWTRRSQDGSTYWRDINTPVGFHRAAAVYMQNIGFNTDDVRDLMGTARDVTGFASLFGKCNPADLYGLHTMTKFFRARDHLAECKHGLIAQTLLAASTLEIHFSDILAWPQFWRKYLPHYDLLCVRPFHEMVPGVYHTTFAGLETTVTSLELKRTIPYSSMTHSAVSARMSVKSNSDVTSIWRLAEENQELAYEADTKLLRGFVANKWDMFTDEERAVIPWVWRYLTRKRAFIKYMLQCRTPESHVSHSLVATWKHFYAGGGSAYSPEVIRPVYGEEATACPWDFYFHNLTPFGNFRVNAAYHMWSHYNVDPQQVQTALLVIDSGLNATRGELETVGLNPLVYSTDPGVGKSFITKVLLSMTRIPGTTTVVSHKSAGAMHVQRMGTLDDMVVDIDEIKQSVFYNKEEGGMADTKQKELMSTGRIMSRVLEFTGLPGQQGRTEQTYTYNELSTFVATGNLRVMDLRDKAALSRWLLRPHNKCPDNARRRPRDPPHPPAHVRCQLHQMQIAVAEIHKLTQAGAMDVENTLVVEIALDALGSALATTPDTQRKDMQIASLARIHAICDLVVTHFWVPGGLYYNERITPSRLLSLNDFLMVRTEHVVYAIGQMCNSGADSTQHAIMQAIISLWKSPNHTFSVRWGRPLVARPEWESGESFHDAYVTSMTVPPIDTIVFEGTSKHFVKQFCSAIHHEIMGLSMRDADLAYKAVATVDQIESQIRRWMDMVHVPLRAVHKLYATRGLAALAVCDPSVVEFTSDALPQESACVYMETRKTYGLQFPVHMLLSSKITHNVIEGTRLAEIVRYSLCNDQLRAHDVNSSRELPFGAWKFSHVYGGMMPGRPEFHTVIDPPSVADTLSETPPPKPAIPYRYYARIMTAEEYTALTGTYPPTCRDELVPLVLSLDEFAERSRMRTTQMTRVHVSDALFGRVVAKLVLSDFERGRASPHSLKTALRSTLLTWGFLYRKTSTQIYDALRGASVVPDTTARTYANNTMCDYAQMPICRRIVTDSDALALVSRVFTDVCRARAIKYSKVLGPMTSYNQFHGVARCSKRVVYPTSVPDIFTTKVFEDAVLHPQACATATPVMIDMTCETADATPSSDERTSKRRRMDVDDACDADFVMVE